MLSNFESSSRRVYRSEKRRARPAEADHENKGLILGDFTMAVLQANSSPHPSWVVEGGGSYRQALRNSLLLRNRRRYLSTASVHRRVDLTCGSRQSAVATNLRSTRFNNSHQHRIYINTSHSNLALQPPCYSTVLQDMCVCAGHGDPPPPACGYLPS